MFPRKAFITGFLLLIFCTCNRHSSDFSGIDEFLRFAGENRGEIEKVLEHYSLNKADNLKLKAAVFLIKNMRIHYYVRENVELYGILDSLNRSDLSMEEVYARFDSIKEHIPVSPRTVLKDLETLSADFLIQHIDRSFANWESSPWKNQVSFEDFCEYILPYAVGTRKREPWIDYYRDKYLPHISEYMQASNSIHLVDLVDSLNSYLIINHPLSIDFKRLSNWPPLAVDHIRSGLCDDYVACTIYLFRSLGIPTTSDYTPMWSNYITPHSWNSLLSNDGKHYPFLGFEHTFEMFPLFERAPKVFRTTYSIQKESLWAQHLQELIPGFLKQPNLKDVSSEYFPVFDVKVKIRDAQNLELKIAYLYVFNNQTWIPVHGGRVKHDKVTFTDMRGNMVYLPAFYTRTGFVAANDPFILDTLGKVIPLRPDMTNKKRLVLSRKYHTTKYDQYFDKMLHGRFQGANKPGFSDSENLYRIEQIPNPTLFSVADIDKDTKYRYIRYIGEPGTYGHVAELEFYTKVNNGYKPLNGTVIGVNDTLNSAYRRKENVFDKDALTYFFYKDSSAWVGLDLGKPERIDRIRYLPRNDDNNIRPGDIYELLYWDNGGWNSLGWITGDENMILIYNDCPSNALFLLHNHTRGNEERIFTYKNEKQVWW